MTISCLLKTSAMHMKDTNWCIYWKMDKTTHLEADMEERGVGPEEILALIAIIAGMVLLLS